jgi:hypothetical protein
MPVEPSGTDPLEWWKLWEEYFPTLAVMVRDVLAVPLSSCAAERVFSAGRDIITYRRNRLTGTTVKNLMLAKNWWHREVENAIKDIAKKKNNSLKEVQALFELDDNLLERGFDDRSRDIKHERNLRLIADLEIEIGSAGYISEDFESESDVDINGDYNSADENNTNHPEAVRRRFDKNYNAYRKPLKKTKSRSVASTEFISNSNSLRNATVSPSPV